MNTSPQTICQLVFHRGWATKQQLSHCLALYKNQKEKEDFLAFLCQAGCISQRQAKRLVEELRKSTSTPMTPSSSINQCPDSGNLPLQGGNYEKYEIIRQLGEGGMGKVFLARDRDLKRKTAIKICSRQDEEFLLRFLREAQIGSRLEHPNIAPVYDAGRTPKGEIYFAMKYIEGVPFSRLVEGFQAREREFLEKYPLRRQLSIFAKVLEGMGYAHDKGIIHRDLKPENIMIGEFGEVLIVDWGLARSLAEDSSQKMKSARKAWESDEIVGGQTQVGTIMGTPGYLPPEQARGELHRLTPQSDIYSLGVILYEILTLKSPFSGKTSQEVMMKGVENEFSPPRQRTPDRKIPRALEAIVLKAMSTNPEDRYRSTAAFHADIQAYLDDEIPAVYTPPLGERCRRFLARWAPALTILAGIFMLLALFSYYLAREKEEKLAAEQKRRKATKEKKMALEKQLKAERKARLAAARLAQEKKAAQIRKIKDMKKRMSASAYLRMARSHMQQNPRFRNIYNTVIPYLKKALKKYPSLTEARYELIKIYFYLQKKNSALVHIFQLMQSLPPEKRKIFSHVAAIMAPALKADRDRSKPFRLPENFDQARPRLLPPIQWKALKATLLTELGQDDRALEIVKEVLASEEGRLWEHYLLKARILANSDREDGALKIMNRLVKQFPHIPFLYLNRAQIQRDRQNLPGALKDLLKVKKMDPHCHIMYYSLSKTISERVDWNKYPPLGPHLALALRCHRYLTRALQLEPNYKDAAEFREDITQWLSHYSQLSRKVVAEKKWPFFRFILSQFRQRNDLELDREFALLLHYLWRKKNSPSSLRQNLKDYLPKARKILKKALAGKVNDFDRDWMAKALGELR